MRFLSHRNMACLCERAAARAQLPIRFSEGFNPRPKFSLSVPRPVGLFSCCELLVMEFDRELEDDYWSLRLGEQFPRGMRLLRAEPLSAGVKVRPEAVTYELALTGKERIGMEKRLSELDRLEKWEVPRRRAPSSRKKEPAGAVVDIRDRIGNIEILPGEENAGCLCFTLKTGPTGLIGPGPVLELLGLRQKYEILARLKRTKIECEL